MADRLVHSQYDFLQPRIRASLGGRIGAGFLEGPHGGLSAGRTSAAEPGEWQSTILVQNLGAAGRVSSTAGSAVYLRTGCAGDYG